MLIARKWGAGPFLAPTSTLGSSNKVGYPAKNDIIKKAFFGSDCRSSRVEDDDGAATDE